MAEAERAQLLNSLAKGELAPRELAGLTRAECAELSRSADDALEKGDARTAARLLELLQVLEPGNPDHLLRHAEARQRLGAEERGRVLALLDRYVESELPQPRLRLARALKLRAALRPESAKEDVRAAEQLERLEARLATLPVRR